MALVKRQSQGSKVLVIVFVVVIVGAVGYYLLQQFQTTANLTDIGITPSTHPVITNFGQAIFQDPRYLELQDFGASVNANVETDAGQINPFQ